MRECRMLSRDFKKPRVPFAFADSDYEQIEIVERRDDFTSRHELLQIIAIPERFVIEELLPEGERARLHGSSL